VSFEQVKDQDVAIATLKMAIRKNRLAHAYLFEGPDGVGKTLTAVAFAKAVNCEEGGDDSCDVCWSCLRIDEFNHPDVTLIEPTKAGRAIHVDTMEELIARSSLKPYRAKYRVAIIVDAERMNDAAANKFLKTLEEPPGNSLFILVSHSPEQLPATTVSRCQRVKFHPIAARTIAVLLTRDHGVSPEQAAVISVLAQGQMSTASELARSEKREFVTKAIADLAEGGDPLVVLHSFLGRLRADRERLKESVAAEAPAAEADSEELAGKREAYLANLSKKEVLSYLHLLRAWYRDALVLAETGSIERLWNGDQAELVAEQMRRFSPGEIEQKLEAITRAETLLEYNVGEEQVFRDLFFSLSQLQAGAAHRS